MSAGARRRSTTAPCCAAGTPSPGACASPSAPPTSTRQCSPSWNTAASSTGPGSSHLASRSLSSATRASSSSLRSARAVSLLSAPLLSASNSASSACAPLSSAAWLTSNAARRSLVRRCTSESGHRSYARLVPTRHTPLGLRTERGTSSERPVPGDTSSSASLATALSAGSRASATWSGTSPAPVQSITSTTLFGPSSPIAAGSTPVSSTATRTLRPSYCGKRRRNASACVACFGRRPSTGKMGSPRCVESISARPLVHVRTVVVRATHEAALGRTAERNAALSVPGIAWPSQRLPATPATDAPCAFQGVMRAGHAGAPCVT